ncbi:MAG: NAD(P)-binding domain-containing protein [Alphaproteobacteria bacterium]|nr:NAD(P)-binding domain-containing protein [Alphaproteobacteria bacterium]
MNVCDIAIIGAGPHGLSLAAQLAARGMDFRVFGKPLSTWSEHMPKNMVLKSDGFVSNLSSPAQNSTLRAYCARNRIPYADEGMPVSLETFLSYANDFRKRFVPMLEEVNVASLKAEGDLFGLTLETGEQLQARNVVLAIGITSFAYTPPVLAKLSAEVCSHSFAHREGGGFEGKEVVVIGRGASAVDLAWLLHQQGAFPRIVARSNEIDFNKVPDAYEESLIGKLHRPASGIGRGWKSLFCAQAPLLFYRLPEALRRRAIASHMHPAGGWFMREKVESNIPMFLGRSIRKAEAVNGRVELTMRDRSGEEETIRCDHVIAATGYEPDMRKVPFLAPELVNQISPRENVTLLSDVFETAVAGLYAVGLPAMHNFGPLMRFMVGAEFAAPRVASALHRKLGRVPDRRAA